MKVLHQDVVELLSSKVIPAKFNANAFFHISESTDSVFLLNQLIDLGFIQSLGDGLHARSSAFDTLMADYGVEINENGLTLAKVKLSRWIEKNYHEATTDLIRACYEVYSDSNLAENLVRQLFFSGRFRVLLTLFDLIDIPEENLKNSIFKYKTWCEIFTRGYSQADSVVANFESRSSETSDPELLALEPIILILRDDLQGALKANLANLEFVSREEELEYTLLITHAAALLAAFGRFSEASYYITKFYEQSLCTYSDFFNQFFCTIEGWMELMEGRGTRARSRYESLITEAERKEGRKVGLNAILLTAYIDSLYFTFDLPALEHAVDRYKNVIADFNQPDQIITLYRTMVRMADLKHDSDQAEALLLRWEAAGTNLGLFRIIIQSRLERIRINLNRNNIYDAKRDLIRVKLLLKNSRKSLDTLPGNEVEDYDLARVRFLVRFRNSRKLHRAIDNLIRKAEKCSLIRRATKLKILLAWSHERCGNLSDARQLFFSCLDTIKNGGGTSLIHEEGPDFEAFALAQLNIYKQQSKGHAVQTDTIIRHFAVAPESAEGKAVPELPTKTGSLTPKELKVLQLVAKGFTNKEIGESLAASESTVRAHLRNINIKLDTKNRIEALNEAKRLMMLSDG